MKPLLALVCVVLTACTQTYQFPALSQEHPANPDAPAAPLPARSQALAPSSDMHAGPAASVPATAPNDAAAAYVCPMHPKVTSDKPDQRCPECGMKLVPKSEVEDNR